jgi:peptide/nickel transport system substrate-binding protein
MRTIVSTWHRGLRTAALALALPALAASAIAALAAAPAEAQTLEIATDQSPVGLDPHIATAFSTQLIDSNIYEGLTAIDAGLHTVPAVAASWTVSPDGLAYTFKLRPGEMFQNGKKVTAADVVASVERVRNPRTGSPYASRFAAISKVEAVDPETVRFMLSAPSAPFLTQLAALAIVPEEATQGDINLAKQPMGTGPFRFKEWVPDTDIVLEKNPYYWAKGLPKLAALKFDVVPEAATRQLGLQGGTYQMLPSIDAATAAALAGKPGIKLLKTQDLAYSLVGMNVTKPPFDKPEVREAFNMALNRAQIVQAAYYGQGVPGGPLSPDLKDWAMPISAFPCYKTDPAAAKQLLRKAGLTLPVAVTLNVLGSVQQVVDVAQVVQAQAGKAGFDVKLNVQEAGRFIQDWRNHNFQGFVSLNGGSPEPDDYLGRTFETGGATNVYGFSDPALDKLLIQARATSNVADRNKLYDQAQRMLACTGPVAHLVYGTLITAIRSDVQGFQISPTRSLWSLRETGLSK